jgi:dTDP-4-amino-4,6-dideoxygalactose transaminase
MATASEQLALDGGPKTIVEPLPWVGFGAELIGEEEERFVLEALRGRKLCRIAHSFADSFAHRVEEEIRRRFDTPFALVVNSCASALHVALVSLDIGPGDEVLVAGVGWFAVAAAVLNVGAVPVPVGYDESLTIDLDDLEHRVTDRTRALIVIQWRGLPADMTRLLAIARACKFRIIEDVAQSFGASYRGRALGTLGDIGCYSFNMHKILSGGEGGALVMRDGLLYKRAVSFSGMYNMYLRRFDDGERQSMPALPMLNFRMPELCAAMILAQLSKLDAILGLLRARGSELASGIAANPWLRAAVRHDPEGDCGYTLPLVFDGPEKADFFFRAMRAEGATTVSNSSYGFGGGEARGTAALVASEGLDPTESGQMVFADTWRCLTAGAGPTEKLNPWKLTYGEQRGPGGGPDTAAREVGGRSRERLSRVVALKTNVHLKSEHTAAILEAAKKVTHVMRQRFPS